MRQIVRLSVGGQRVRLRLTNEYGTKAVTIGAATVAGIYWGLLRALGMSMPALITSHVAWDIWIFLLAPTEPEPEEATG